MKNFHNINTASKILDNGFSVIESYLKEEDKVMFFTAIQNDSVKDFILQKKSNYTSKIYNKILDFYKIFYDYNSLKTAHTAELLGFIFDFEKYQENFEKGILYELEYISKELENSFEKENIIQIIEEEIKIINLNCDTILKYDKKEQKEKEAQSIEDFEEYKNASQKGNMELAHLVLSKLSPNKEQILGIRNKETIEILWTIFEITSKQVIKNSGLDIYKQNEILRNPPLFFQFLFDKERNIITSSTFFIYLQLNFNYEQLIDEGLLTLFWVAVDNYRKYDNNSIDDNLTLIKTYLFLNNLYNEVDSQNLITEKRIKRIKFFNLNNLAKTYEQLHDYETAIKYYSEILKEEQIENEAGNELKEFGIIQDIVDCYLKIDDLKAIQFISNILNGDLTEIGIDENFLLPEGFKEMLEGVLIQTFIDKGESFEKLNIKSEIMKSWLEMLTELKKSDTISTDKIAKFSEMADAWKLQLYEDTFEEVSYEDKAKLILESLAIIEPEISVFNDKVKELNQIKRHIVDELLNLRIELTSVKLKILQEDKKSIEDLGKLISKIETKFDISEKLFWYQEYIRAISMDILKNTDNKIKTITEYSLKAINLIITKFFTVFKESYSQNVAQGEIEKTIDAIFLSVELLEKKETRYIGEVDLKTRISSISFKIEKLIKLVWNLIYHKNIIFNNLLSFNTHTIINKNLFLDIQKIIKQNFYKTAIEENSRGENLIKEKSEELVQLSMPKNLKNLFINKLIEPNVKTILFFLFTNVDDEKKLLSISYNPNGHEKRTYVKFNYSFINKFNDFEILLTKGLGLGFKREGINAFLKKDERVKIFYDSLLKPFLGYLEEGDNDTKLLNMLYLPNKKFQSENKDDFFIISDGFLHRIPFEYLTPKNQTPIGLKNNISYVSKSLEMSSNIKKDNGIAFFYNIPKLGSYKFLEFSNQEIKGIKQICQENSIRTFDFSSTKATLSNLKKIAVKKPSIIHFSTHGIANPEFPSNVNSLLLSKEGDNNSSALLLYQDIIHIDLKGVELVVLSACDSSLGAIKRGLSMQGVANAFLLAGAKSVIATKNKVDDKATAIFMKFFYKFLMNSPVPEALRKAREYFHQTNYQDFEFKYEDKTLVLGKEKEELSKLFLTSWGVWQ